MTITMTENEAMFKHIRRMPVGQLKAISDDELQKIREVLVTEVREIARAQQWIDGIKPENKVKAAIKTKAQGNGHPINENKLSAPMQAALAGVTPPRSGLWQP